MTKHVVIPDTQVKPGVPMEHLAWAGEYIAEKRPDKIIHIGDHWDMPSLSSYDVGKKSFEGRRYTDDIDAGLEGMDILLKPIHRAIKQSYTNHKKRWNPEFYFFTGNHEQRIQRAVEVDRKLEGLISYEDLQLNGQWRVYDYLVPEVIDGIAYCHYFITGVMGRAVSSARALLAKKHMSCVMGHTQRRDIAYDYTADGKQITGLFAGAYYQHDEDYMGPQGNRHWRGIWMLHQVNNGSFDEMPVSLQYLKERYS